MFQNKEKEISLKKLLIDLYSHISQRRKIQLFLLVLSFILSSFAETLSLAVIAPYLYYIVNPLKIYEFAPIKNFFAFFNINFSNSSILLFLTLIVVLSTLFAGAIRLINLWLSNKVSFGIGSDIGCLSYNNILYQDYEYHLSANSNNLIATLSNDVNIVIVNIISPIIQLIASLILVILLSIFYGNKLYDHYQWLTVPSFWILAFVTFIEVWLFFYILNKVGAVFVNLSSYLVMPAGFLWGFLIFGETFTFIKFISTLLIGISIFMIGNQQYRIKNIPIE